MARRGCVPATLLGLVSVVALLVALNAVGCCAIDCEAHPEKCEENRRTQRNASVVLLGALAVSAGSLGGAVYVLRRR
jgi:hypothetical protein